MTNNTPTIAEINSVVDIILEEILEDEKVDSLDGTFVKRAAQRILTEVQLRTNTDPNTIPDDVADESQLAFHEYVWGAENWPTKRELGISRQAWKCAIAVAIDKMKEH